MDTYPDNPERGREVVTPYNFHLELVKSSRAVLAAAVEAWKQAGLPDELGQQIAASGDLQFIIEAATVRQLTAPVAGYTFAKLRSVNYLHYVPGYEAAALEHLPTRVIELDLSNSMDGDWAGYNVYALPDTPPQLMAFGAIIPVLRESGLEIEYSPLMLGQVAEAHRYALSGAECRALIDLVIASAKDVDAETMIEYFVAEVTPHLQQVIETWNASRQG